MNQLVANIILASSLKSSICSPKQPNSRKILHWFTNSLRETSHGLKIKSERDPAWTKGTPSCRWNRATVRATSNIDSFKIFWNATIWTCYCHTSSWPTVVTRRWISRPVPTQWWLALFYRLWRSTTITQTSANPFQRRWDRFDVLRGSMTWFWTVPGLVGAVRLFRTDDHGAETDFQRAWSEISVETTIFR